MKPIKKVQTKSIHMYNEDPTSFKENPIVTVCLKKITI